ncbi:MAG: DedA family protein [Bacteroidota bacterium]
MEFIKELLHHLTSVEDIIVWGGYIGLTAVIFSENGLLVGFFLPGDSLLVTAGIFCARGYFNIWYLVVLLCVASILGTSVGYYIGFKTGKKIFTRENSLFFKKSHLIHAHNFYEKYGAITIVLARFMPIVRTFAPVVAGVGEMNYPKFMMYNIIGGIGWIVSMLLIGYTLGSMIPDIDKHINLVIGIVIFASLLPGIIKYFRAKHARAAGTQ